MTTTLFQVKHHCTTDKPTKDARNAVVADFKKELRENVLTRKGSDSVNYFFLLTNVPSSASSLNKIDEVRDEMLSEFPQLHADVWWSEHLTALLDLYPRTWSSFPAMFPGNRVPMLASIAEPNSQDEGTPAAIKLALAKHFRRDSRVKFQQIDLENDIFKLFVDLEVSVTGPDSKIKPFLNSYWKTYVTKNDALEEDESFIEAQLDFGEPEDLSAVTAILAEPQTGGARLIVEGGPGQGKSTVTQVVAQIHRSYLLDRKIENSTFPRPTKLRVPFRIELRYLAEWIASEQGSLEQYICHQISLDSGGNTMEVKDFHRFSKETRLLLIFDGLDEIGSDDLRNKCVTVIEEGLERLTEELSSDLQVIITTRPPAFSNFADRFSDYLRLRVQPMEEHIIETYVNRWLEVQQVNAEISHQIRRTYFIRSQEPHVHALARNPMQLSVLLHFMRLKGEAFPSRRAELYKDYFKVVIDRDVAKTPELAPRREIVEYLHEFLGYKIHALSEAEKTDGSISYQYLIELIDGWLKKSGDCRENASDLLKVGEERLGLLVAIKGEGESTHYGFEIQPIREYFAAAYISNQSSGNAHDCFQELVIRPFWREVALFLAGLRRSNEKADLIYRLLSIDEKHKDSHERPGIEILLPLTEEGIFDRPPALFSHAIENLLVVADPEARIKCELGHSYFERISKLINSRKQQNIIDLVKSIRNKSFEFSDDSAIITACNIAAKSLDEYETKKFISDLPDLHPRTTCIIKIQPITSGIDITDLTHNPEFWEGVDDDIWQNYLWRLYRLEDQIKRFQIPDNLYAGILGLFATDPLPNRYVVRRHSANSHIIDSPPENIHAVWAIVLLNDLMEATPLSSHLYVNEKAEGLFEFSSSILKGKTEVLCQGLNEDLSRNCMKLISLSAKILRAISQKEERENLKNLVREEFEWLTSSLKTSGLTSLVIARALSNILTTCYVYDYSERHSAKTRDQLRLIIKDLTESDECFYQLTSSLCEFMLPLTSQKIKINPGLILSSLERSTPKNCRLSGTSSLISIRRAQLDAASNEEHPDNHWLKPIPIDQNSALELLKGKKGEELAEILAFIGTTSLRFPGLIQQGARGTFKTFRPTTEFGETAARFREKSGVPSGYLLIQTACQNICNADYDLLKAGLFERYQYNRQSPVPDLFDVSRAHYRNDSEHESSTLKVLDKLATDIINEPGWPISMVRQAIRFLSRRKHTEHPALIDLESKLGL